MLLPIFFCSSSMLFHCQRRKYIPEQEGVWAKLKERGYIRIWPGLHNFHKLCFKTIPVLKLPFLLTSWINTVNAINIPGLLVANMTPLAASTQEGSPESVSSWEAHTVHLGEWVEPFYMGGLVTCSIISPEHWLRGRSAIFKTEYFNFYKLIFFICLFLQWFITQSYPTLKCSLSDGHLFKELLSFKYIFCTVKTVWMCLSALVLIKCI